MSKDPSTPRRPPDLEPPPRQPRLEERAPVREVLSSGRRHPLGLLLTGAFFAVLVVATLAVFLLLPRWVASQDEAADRSSNQAPNLPLEAPPSIERTEAANDQPSSDADWRDEAAERRDARALLETLQAKLEALGERDFARWGGEDARRGQHLFKLGKAKWKERDFAGAGADWQRSLDLLAKEEARLPQLTSAAVSEGDAALERGDLDAAKLAYQRALRLTPGDGRARAGLERAEHWGDVVALTAAAEDAAARRDWSAAAQAYSRVLALDASNQAARRGLERARRERADGDFAAVMTEALGALDRGEWNAARDALARAEKMRPGAPQVAETYGRVQQAERLEKLESLGEKAARLEAEERWSEAAERYRQMLAVDQHLSRAGRGLEHAAKRAELQAALDAHLEKPTRLTDAAVLEEASELLERAAEVEDAGPEHLRRVEALGALLDDYGQKVVAELHSDGQTEVTVYRVGRLGTFEERRLELRPGTYTVVGSRSGYRDVRRRWVIEPDEAPPPLDVRCREAL